ncbi:cobaltochelatase subunit CobN [Pelagibacterium xiamenense]|uniref:cobaltochelatase subunit CobN n=1 Tax=Pelagibacterium xiamenense TaxID=2901140 RepID=UPI001E57826D|nr:cobaltochelatase subunit CobN [Pelagibacterium xiamenense]MCD7058798.1 cobaltochelatase subunit CobN [Pelagibacterium xiamenense]
MHLLAAQAGALQQDGEAIDLAQSPGRIAFASSADSELTMLAAAADRAGEDGLRLANIMRLAHNFSVDLWCENTLGHAKLIVIRLIGGAGYWPYGCDEIETLARSKGIALAFLPGDAQPDPVLLSRSTIDEADWHKLHALFLTGGPGAADAILGAFNALAEGRAVPGEAAAPMPKFGFWNKQKGITQNLADFPKTASDAPCIPMLFYRAVLEGAGTATFEALVNAIEDAGLTPLPIVVSSLKQSDCAQFVRNALGMLRPAAIFNLTGFALGVGDLTFEDNPFALTDAPVIQLVQGSRPPALWEADPQGLTQKDLAMQVVLPEIDGRIGGLLVGHKAEAVWHARTECPLTAFTPEPDGIARAVKLAKNYTRLRATPRADRRIGIVLANYPLRDGRLANGVGYDAPQSTVEMLRHLSGGGYDVGSVPETGTDLIDHLLTGPTNARPQHGTSDALLPLARYRALFAQLHPCIREGVPARWGEPEADAFVRDDAFHLPIKILGNVAILLQPARAYGLPEEESYHDPNLVPPHAYIAAYLWLTDVFGAHAFIHNGKHGNLEWLPGKANALDGEAYPLILSGQLPNLYPFIVNDPGEGTQAKRRTVATIIDHLVPPLTRAETYGPLKDLEALLDEYYTAMGMDQRRLDTLKRRILDFTRDTRLDADIGLPEDETQALNQVDNFLCELKEAQIRDGLHVFGRSPTGSFERDLVVAFARVPRGEGRGGDASLIRALAEDLRLGADPLALELGAAWTGPRPEVLDTGGVWRSCGDTIERLEALAAELVSGRTPDLEWIATRAVLETIERDIRPRVTASGPAEVRALVDGLDGKFIAPGPSGAPTRGRIDTLPTGRNFYAVDNRAVPTQTAWALGQRAAESLLTRHFQDTGTWLASVAMSVWGTANMRTGGDDIAQALALIGARPTWQGASLTISGYEIIPLAKLGRPRVDVTLRISGFFRDAFPAQIALFDKAVRAIGALDEPEEDNPIAARMRTDALSLMSEGHGMDEAALKAGHRIFGAAPGGYGAGVGKRIEDGRWQERADLAQAVLDAGQYAYGAHVQGEPEHGLFAHRLRASDAVLHVQDNREHDLLDSDQYYQFEGGLAAAVEALAGARPATYHTDTSRPERVVVRTLEEEIARVMRARVVNPKWIAGVKRHGYRGAFEIIATVDYMFGFAATTGAVKPHHFDLAFEAYIEDDDTRAFLIANNRFGYDELIARFNEARERGLWSPRTNSAYRFLEQEGSC